jgi:hypothetical protein
MSKEDYTKNIQKKRRLVYSKSLSSSKKSQSCQNNSLKRGISKQLYDLNLGPAITHRFRTTWPLLRQHLIFHITRFVPKLWRAENNIHEDVWILMIYYILPAHHLRIFGEEVIRTSATDCNKSRTAQPRGRPSETRDTWASARADWMKSSFFSCTAAREQRTAAFPLDMGRWLLGSVFAGLLQLMSRIFVGICCFLVLYFRALQVYIPVPSNATTFLRPPGIIRT